MTEDQKQIASLIAQVRCIKERLLILEQREMHREEMDFILGETLWKVLESVGKKSVVTFLALQATANSLKDFAVEDVRSGVANRHHRNAEQQPERTQK